MANEAAVTMVMRMRDEASPKLKNVGKTMEQTQVQSLQFGLALTTLGSAMGALGGLMGQIDHPMAKMLQNFLMLGSAAILSISAIGQLIPVIKSLTGVTRALAIAKAFLLGLSGPAGWAMLGAGLALGAGAHPGPGHGQRTGSPAVRQEDSVVQPGRPKDRTLACP
jgi:hypothetical protein